MSHFSLTQVAQRWRFQSSPVSVAKQGLEGQQGVAEVLPSARVSDLGAILSSKGYKVSLCIRVYEPCIYI